MINLRRSKREQANSTARKIVSSAVSETVGSSSHSAMDERNDAANQFGRKAYRK